MSCSLANNNANDNQSDTSQYNHQCYICDKIFSANSNLNRHLRKIHQENVQSPYNNVKCALCESTYSSSSIYNQHLEKDHQVRIEIDNLKFADKKSFEDWKHGVENETTSQYIKSRGEKKTKNVNKTYYSCNRSGYYVSKARTRKALKKQGSRKINGRCPASMNVTVNTDLSYDVRFVKTHVGHDFELKHLDLSDKDRDLIFQKLISGLTKRDIIKQIRAANLEQQNGPSLAASVSPASSISIPPLQQPVKPIGHQAVSGIEGDCVSMGINCVEINSSGVNEVVIGSNSTIANNVLPLETPTITVNNSFSNNILSTSNGSHPSSRLHLATTKDIHNIINSKHLNSKLIRHNYDMNNFEAWINEMKEYNQVSTVLFYKPQSEISPRFIKLRPDDFIMVVMKDGQAEILKKYGDKCIIIDSTHNIHCEYLQVALVSVIDSENKGFPVASLFSTRTDVDVLEVFFTVIKDRVGLIPARMVIADELNDFYQAWTKVMTRPTHNLLTPWSVFDEWSKKFDLIGNREKLRKVKKSLRNLLTESEPDKFQRSLNIIIQDNRMDPDIGEFIKFFEEKFARNPDLWSSCLRRSHGASNYLLWELHDKFKSVYKAGKTSKNLCKYVAGFMRLFEDNQLAELSKIEDKSPTKQKALLDRHRKSVETGSLVYEVADEPVYWLCPAESSNENYYEVTRITCTAPTTSVEVEANTIVTTTTSSTDNAASNQNVAKCCDLKCPSCTACRHEFKCTCLDYVVNLNMCKHIHRICAMCR